MTVLENTKTYVARIKPGEDLLEALEAIVTKNQIQTGTIQMIGAIEKTNVGIYVNGDYEHITHEGPLEIVSGIGNISLKENKPFVHVHLMLSDHKGKVFGGHLFKGCVVHPTAEVFITEMKPAIKRKYDEKLNWWPLDM